MMVDPKRLEPLKVGTTTYKLKPLNLLEKAAAMQALAMKGIRDVPRRQMLSGLRKALLRNYDESEIGQMLEAIDRSGQVKEEGRDNQEVIREVIEDNDLIQEAETLAGVDKQYNTLRGTKVMYFPYLQWYIVKFSLKKIGKEDVEGDDGTVSDERMDQIPPGHMAELSAKAFDLLAVGEEERKNSK